MPGPSVLLTCPALKLIRPNPRKITAVLGRSDRVEGDFISLTWALVHWWGRLDPGTFQGQSLPCPSVMSNIALPLSVCTKWEGIHHRAAPPAPACPALQPAPGTHGPAPCMVWHPSSNASTALHGANQQAASHCHHWPTPLLHHQLLHPSAPHHPCLAMEPRPSPPSFTCRLP